MKNLSLSLFAVCSFLFGNVFGQVSFTPSTTNGCAPLSISFNNTSVAGPNYVWYYGDGSPADTVQHANHTFTNAGNYYVYMYAYNASWIYQGSYGQNIFADGPMPIQHDYDTICVGDNNHFHTNSGGNNFAWDMGDGTVHPNHGQGIAHSYSSAGTYAVSCTVDGNCGTYVLHDTVVVVTSGVGIQGWPYLGMSQDSACISDQVSFYTNSYASVAWNFGDGNSANGENVSNQYGSLGWYNVDVTLTNGCGADTTLYDSIKVVNSMPVLNPQVWGVDTVCPGEQFYINAYANNAVSYSWNFNDGSPVQNGQNPQHTYNSLGTYNVQVTMTNGCGNDSIINYQVVVDNSNQISNSYFSVHPNVICPGDETGFQLDYQYSNVIDFGDGTQGSGESWYNHTYAAPGVYPVSVTYTNQCGNTLVMYDTVHVQMGLPFNGDIGMQLSSNIACPGMQVDMWANNWGQTYNWDFGDGNSSGNIGVNHAYATTGTYQVSLTVTNGCGSDSTFIDSILVGTGLGAENIQTQIPDSICPGQQFNAQAWATNGQTFTWDFNDGNTPLTGSGIVYTLNTLGTQNVTLTVSSYCGVDSIVNTSIVVADSVAIPDPNFNLSSNYICPGDEVYFNFNTNGNYFLDFGDGTGSSNAWGHVYNTVGTYPVSFTLQNACGAVLVVHDTVHVQNGLNFMGNQIYVDAWPNILCPNTPFGFSTQSGYSSYLWDFGDGITSTNRNTDHGFTTIGSHNVSVTITNGCGMDTTLYTTVTTAGNLPLTGLDYQIHGDSVCPGDQILFAGGDDDGDGDGIDYTWDFGDGTSSTENLIGHAYDSIGWYTITMHAVNACGTDTTIVDSVYVGNGIDPNPSAFEAMAQEEGCIGDQLYFVINPSGAGDITWDFGDGNSSSETEVVDPGGMNAVDVIFHSYNSPGMYTATYTFTNGCGNSYTDSVQVQVGGVGALVDVEAIFWWDQTVPTCQGQPVNFTAVGGATYIWDFGDNSGVLVTNTSMAPVPHSYDHPGTYNVTLQTYNTCGSSDMRSEEIFIPDSKVNISTNSVADADCGENTGMAVVSAQGGTPPYTYAWTNGDDGVIADSLYSGIYVVAVTDANGCTSEGIASVSDEEGPTILLENIIHNDCYGDNDGSISVEIMGGAPPYTISWSNGDLTEDIFGLEAGPYEIFVTDANGCFATETFRITEPEETVISIVTTPSACGASDGQAIGVLSNGAGPFNYIWPNNTGIGLTQTAGLAPGVHELIVIDGNTCLHRKEFVVNEAQSPIILTDSIINGTCSGSMSSVYIGPIAGVTPYTYSWSNGTTDEDMVGVTPGYYSVEVTGANGCTSYQSFELEMSTPDEVPICLVTVDSTLGVNRIVWEPVSSPDVVEYNIYKESSQSGLYFLAGTQSADSISQFDDVNSDPTIRSWRYKIATVDNCGNESEWSDSHKTIHLSANLGVGNVVNLLWDEYEGFGYSTYYINRYHPSTGWLVIDSVASNVHSYTDMTPPSDSLLVYSVDISSPELCTAEKAVDHNNTRSNQGRIGAPEEDIVEDTTGNGIIDLSLIDVVVYPNPNSGMSQVVLSNIDVEYDLTITDARGRVIERRESMFDNVIDLDLTDVEDGLYFVRIESKIGTFVRQMMKN